MLVNSFKWSPRFWKEFNKNIPIPKIYLEGELLAPPKTKNYALVGAAFDYVFCWHIERLNKRVLRTGGIDPLISGSKVLYKITGGLDCDDDYPGSFPVLRICNKVQNMLSKAKKLRSKFIENGKTDNSTLKMALSLAQLDSIYHRIDIRGEDDWKQLESYIMQLGNVEALDVIDLKNLISIVDWDLFKAKRICITHPILSHCVADLLIDNKIVELKTSKYLKINRNDYSQIVAYFLLINHSGARQSLKKLEADTLCIYFSRHGYFYQKDANDIINKSYIPRVAKWFEKYRFK